MRRPAPPPDPGDDMSRRFGTTCPVCGLVLGTAAPRLDPDTDRFISPPSFRLEVGAADTRSRQPWRVTMLAGNYPPAESTDPRFNPHDVDFVYLLCGDGHIFPDETPAFRAGAQRGPAARQRVDDFNMVAAVGSPASGKTYLLIRTLSQNLDILTHWNAHDDPHRIRSRRLSPLEELPTAGRVQRFNETRNSGAAIVPTGTESAAFPYGILRLKFPGAHLAIQALIAKTVLDGRLRAENWGKGFRQPLVLRTDSGDFRTWTGVADLPGELFTENSINQREAGLLRSFDALVWVVDPAVAPRASDWMAVDPNIDEQLQLDGSLRPGTSTGAGAHVVRINRESIQDDIGQKITIIDGPFTVDSGRRLQMLVAISKCDLIHAALGKPGLHLRDLGAPDEVQRGTASYLAFALGRWSRGLVVGDPRVTGLFEYLRGAPHAAESGRRRRIEQVAGGLLDHYSTDTEFWKLVHVGADTEVTIPADSIAEHPQRLLVPSLDEHLDAARRPGTGDKILLRDLVMSAVGGGIAYALGQETALFRMHREPWMTLRFFLCSPLTTVPVAVDDLRLKPLNPRDRFPRVDERSAGLTQLLLALLERARR